MGGFELGKCGLAHWSPTWSRVRREEAPEVKGATLVL